MKQPGDIPFADAYPRPMLQRRQWICLNGLWDLALDPAGRWTAPGHVRWQGKILVPFSPETPLSGVHDTGYHSAVWYRRTFTPLRLRKNQRLILHFGAVDYRARVWVNGALAVEHEGGYTPFSADITDLLTDATAQTLVVCAEDDPLDLEKPRGKQDWQRDPHSIWYYRTTGIWQTVWLEIVPTRHIAQIRWTPCVHRWDVALQACIAAPVSTTDAASADELRLRVRLAARGRLLVDDTCAVIDRQVHRHFAFPDPGIDDARNEPLWFPHNPVLIDAQLELLDANGRVIDAVTSYCAMRQVGVLGDRFILNGRPIQLQMVLNQGYWPNGGLTAPDDSAYRRDVELIKSMGFNGVRMHQKIENPRFLHWADRLGLLVWEEMPSPYRFSPASIARMTRQWIEALDRDASHPCIVAWVPFNESWGVPDLPDSPAQRHAIQALYHLTRTLDPTRPVIGNDGWEAAATDIIAIHDYDADPARIARRYAADEQSLRNLLRSERPGFKVLLLDGFPYAGQPIMLTEFGGIAYSPDTAHTWGYSRATSPDDLADRYFRLMHTVRSLPLLAGFCYTQFTDTYLEVNGLLYMDRTPKFDLERMAIATRGPRTRHEHTLYTQWRQRLSDQQPPE